MKYFINIIAIWSILTCLFSQEAEENIFSSEAELYHQTELFGKLTKIKISPLNINDVSKKELEIFPWLSEKDIKNILAYLRTNSIKKISDLEKAGINKITISEIEPYFQVKRVLNPTFSNSIRAEYQQAKADLPSTVKYLQKTIINYSNFNFGFISQKDEGERNPFDFYSYYAEYCQQNKHFILGKYRVFLGQGILFAPKLGISKSAAATYGAFKQSDTIRPYTSSYEIWELQGVAFDYKFSNLKLTAFGSHNSLSANISDNKITSFNQSGNHLDPNKKDNVIETILGSALSYNYKNIKLGIYAIKQKFDLEIDGKNNNYLAIGTDFNIFTNDYPLFGEIAYADKKVAMILGNKWGDNQIRQLLVFRYYQKDFPTWHGKPFSAQSSFDNERGIYYGITYIARSNLRFNIYFDVWQHPETRFWEKMPTSCNEQLFQLEYKHQYNSFRLRIQNRNKEKYITVVESKIRDVTRTVYRFDWSNDQSSFSLKHRLEYTYEYIVNEKIFEKGYLVFSQLSYKSSIFQLIFRIAAYNTDVLIYMYENNVDGIMQNRIFSGDGFYAFGLTKIKLNSKVELQAKISNILSESDNLKLYLQLITHF